MLLDNRHRHKDNQGMVFSTRKELCHLIREELSKVISIFVSIDINQQLQIYANVFMVDFLFFMIVQMAILGTIHLVLSSHEFQR